MKIIGRILVLLLILAILAGGLFYGYIYYTVNDRHEPYMDLILKYSKENNVDEKLVTAITKTESDFIEKAESGAGAKGLMQIMPDTGEWISQKLKEKEYNPTFLFDPETNIKYGTYHLKYLIDYYDNNVDFAIMAYNAGHGNVNKWISQGLIKENSKDYDQVPFPETRNYIRKVNDQWEMNKSIFDIYYLDNESSKSQKAFNIMKKLIVDYFTNK